MNNAKARERLTIYRVFLYIYSYRKNPGSRVHTRSPAQLRGGDGKTLLSLEGNRYQQEEEQSVSDNESVKMHLGRSIDAG